MSNSEEEKNQYNSEEQYYFSSSDEESEAAETEIAEPLFKANLKPAAADRFKFLQCPQEEEKEEADIG